MSLLEPVLKWAGGKRRIAPTVFAHIGSFVKGRFFEPFVGGGAISLHALGLGIVSSSRQLHWNDINGELIGCYRTLLSSHEKVLRQLGEWDATEDCYYRVRDLDRKVGLLNMPDFLIAARTIYLNKVGFNGLYRVNGGGYFNSPWGRNPNRNFVDGPGIGVFAHQLKNIGALTSMDFGEFLVLAQPTKDDVVYCDPPYLPLTKTANFTSYTKDGCGEEDHRRLASAGRAAAGLGAKVVISSSDTPLAREIYAEGFHPVSITAPRSIAADGGKRKDVKEVLFVAYERPRACSSVG